MQINCTINDRQVQRAFARAAGLVGDMFQLMNRIGQEYEKSVLDNFKSQVSPEGRPWQRLSQATLTAGLVKRKGFKKSGDLKAKGKKWLAGKKILIGRGDLEQAIHYQADKNQVVIGVGGHIPYGAIHQFGGPAGRKSKRVMIPARPYLAENDGTGLRLAARDREMIMRLSEKHIRAALE